LTTPDLLHLPSGQQAIPASALDYVQALDTISKSSGLAVTVPDFGTLDDDDYRAVIGSASVLQGEQVRLTWSAMTARIRPGIIDSSQARVARPLITEQDLIANISGVEHHIGRAFTYLLSARIEENQEAQPDTDGHVEVTIVPGDSTEAIMTTEALAPEALQQLTVES
jgi:hypothetical protein